MFINMNEEMEPHKNNFIKAGAVIAGGLLLLVLVSSLKGTETIPLNNLNGNDIGLVKNLGKVLYDKYMLPFEVSALLFLAAMVGAVMLGKKEIK